MLICEDKTIPCYVIYSDAASLTIYTRGKPLGLASAHGLSSIKTAFVKSESGHLDGRTVWHTDDEDAYYKFITTEISVLSW